MGIVVKQSLWGTAIAYVGVLVGYVNTLILKPVYLDLDEIGVFQLITANAMMISPIVSFGMPGSYIKFFPTFQPSDRNKLFTFFILIVFCFNLLILLGGIFLYDIIRNYYLENAPEYVPYLTVTAIIIFINSSFEIFYSYSRSVLRVALPTLIREVFLRLGNVLIISLYGLDVISFPMAAYGLGVIYVIALLLLVFNLFLKWDLSLDFKFSFLTKEWIHSVLSFAIFSMLLTFSFSLLTNTSYTQIASILGNSANGIFTTCFFIGVIVEMPKRNMMKVVSPIISSAMTKGSFGEVHKIFQRSSITMSTIGCLIYIGILTNTQDLFLFIPKGDEFAKGYWVIVTVCTAKLIIMISGAPGEIISYSKNYKVNLLLQVLAALLLIFLNEIFIPIWGLNGVGIGYLIAISFLFAGRLIYVYLKFNIHPFFEKHLLLILISGVVGIIAFLFNPNIHPIISIVLRSILTSMVFVFLVFRFKISEDINKLINSTFERFNIKLNNK